MTDKKYNIGDKVWIFDEDTPRCFTVSGVCERLPEVGCSKITYELTYEYTSGMRRIKRKRELSEYFLYDSKRELLNSFIRKEDDFEIVSRREKSET